MWRGLHPTARRIREAGIRLKVNTVVTSLNADEDMSALVLALRPERWKILRVLTVTGQNDGKVEALDVDADRFRAFVRRHESLQHEHRVRMVPEDHHNISGTYAMVDPGGRFFDDTQGGHTYSEPILDVGVGAAWQQVQFSAEGFEARSGNYDWTAATVSADRLVRRSRTEPPRLVALTGLSGAGKDTVGEILAKRGYQRVALADQLKRYVQAIFELSDEQLWGDERNVEVPHLGMTPRRLYQRFGATCVELDADVWRRPWTAEIRRRQDDGERIVCTDVRTPEELDAIRQLGGEVWRVVRPGSGAPGSAGKHVTERALAELPNRAFDAVIANIGSLEELWQKVEVALGVAPEG